MIKRGNYVIEGNGKNDKLGTGRTGQSGEL